MLENEDLRRELEDVILAAQRTAADVGAQVEAVLREGLDHPLSQEDAVKLLTQVIETLKRSSAPGNDALKGETAALVERVMAVRERAMVAPARRPGIELVEFNGLKPASVRPRPTFHTRPVPMKSGFVKLTDLQLWDQNVRLDIHLAQFQQKHGRKPNQAELIDIMTNGAGLPGTTTDQFEVAALARSIAANGVQKPPILNYDGKLLDGNRRVTACHYILRSNEFGPEEKKRVEYIFVWQLTEDATPDDEDAVVVALNFESDCKKQWPDYIKARKVYEEWQSILALEPLTPGPQRQAEMKRALSKQFALGPDTAVVNRFLKMIEWANEFEDYHVNDRGHDDFEVKHSSNKHFQYFDEIAKGARSGVAFTLDQDENFKHIVFDLLLQGKFKSFALIRKLKYLDEDVRAGLLEALNMPVRNEDELEAAQDKVEAVLDAAHARNAESRQLGANSKIESFTKFLEDLPVKAFRDSIKPDNLRKLLRALQLVEGHARSILGEAGAA